jgi:hypothetical protein
MVAPITLLTPAAPFVVSIAEDLVVSWSGGESGATVHFTILALPMTTGDGGFYESSLDCVFDATAATGTIPKADLTPFQGQTNLTALWSHERDVRFWAGSYPLELAGLRFWHAPVMVQ